MDINTVAVTKLVSSNGFRLRIRKNKRLPQKHEGTKLH